MTNLYRRRIYRRRRAVVGLCALMILGATAAWAAQEATEGPDPPAVRGLHAAGRVTTLSGTGIQASPQAHRSPSEQMTGPGGVYQAITSGLILPSLRDIKPRVYVPNNTSNTVDVIDPKTFKIVGHFDVGYGPQHITPAWDMRRLYVGNTYSNTLTVIDPRTAKPVRTISVFDPYNLYFTPDGSTAVDVAERLNTLYFYDPHTWLVKGKVTIPYGGADHLDFSADGSYLLISTEYAGRLVKVDVRRRVVTGSVGLGGSPVDVKLSPDGSVFFVANQIRNGVSVVDPVRMKEIAFIRTGRGAHGFCVSRDATSLYVSNRLAGTISVIDFATRKVVRTWDVGGSPDMMQVTPDGRELWVSNRYNGTVSVIDTRTGKVLHVIAVGSSPHGLTYFPQPGRYSIGHNGVYR